MKKHLYIITGTSSGIGKSMVEELLIEPKNIVIGISRTQTIFNENYTHFSIDLTKMDELKSFKMPSIENFSIVSLINNAGILGEIAPLKTINIETIEQCIQVNYTALMLLCTKFIQAYQTIECQKNIINISSGAASSAYASWANYCSSKSAIEMLTKCINIEQQEESRPILCFAIAPGVVDTNMQKEIRSTQLEKFSMKPKFIELFETGKLFSPKLVAKKIIDVTIHPNKYTEKIFRIEI